MIYFCNKFGYLSYVQVNKQWFYRDISLRRDINSILSLKEQNSVYLHILQQNVES